MQVICVICSDSLIGSNGTEKLSAARCGHTFHEHCIDSWIEKQRKNIAENINPPAATREIKCVFGCRAIEKSELLRIFLDTESDNAQVPVSCRLKPRKELEKELEDMRKKFEELEKSKDNEIDYLSTKLVELDIKHKQEIDDWAINMCQASAIQHQSSSSPSAFASDFYSSFDSSDIATASCSSNEASATVEDTEFIIQKIPETPNGLKEGSQVYLGCRDYSGIVKWLGSLNGKFVAAVHFDLPLGDGSVDGNYRGVKLFDNPDPEYDRFPVYIEELVTEFTS